MKKLFLVALISLSIPLIETLKSSAQVNPPCQVEAETGNTGGGCNGSGGGGGGGGTFPSPPTSFPGGPQTCIGKQQDENLPRDTSECVLNSPTLGTTPQELPEPSVPQTSEVPETITTTEPSTGTSSETTLPDQPNPPEHLPILQNLDN
jgi:hypothetical protein